MSLSDMKISARLILGFAIMGFLIMALGAVALWRSSAIQDDFRTVTDQRIPRVAMLNEVKGQLNQIAIGMRTSRWWTTLRNKSASRAPCWRPGRKSGSCWRA